MYRSNCGGKKGEIFQDSPGETEEKDENTDLYSCVKKK
jgi:hypothetical protein